MPKNIFDLWYVLVCIAPEYGDVLKNLRKSFAAHFRYPVKKYSSCMAWQGFL
jgi:hypothetical protein